MQYSNRLRQSKLEFKGYTFWKHVKKVNGIKYEKFFCRFGDTESKKFSCLTALLKYVEIEDDFRNNIII